MNDSYKKKTNNILGDLWEIIDEGTDPLFAHRIRKYEEMCRTLQEARARVKNAVICVDAISKSISLPEGAGPIDEEVERLKMAVDLFSSAEYFCEELARSIIDSALSHQVNIRTVLSDAIQQENIE